MARSHECIEVAKHKTKCKLGRKSVLADFRGVLIEEFLFLLSIQIIFGTGDSQKAVTLTANVSFLRGAVEQVRTARPFTNH